MSNYTTELRTLLISGYDLGLNNYPVFDEAYRVKLNEKIKNHYMFYEIGFETAERFVYELNRKMDEIMVYYNKLYVADLLDINPLLSYQNIITESKTGSRVVSGVKDTTRLDTKNDLSTLQSDTELNTFKELTENSSVTNDNTSNTQDNTNESSNGKNVSSDTPTSVLLSGEIEGDVYATNAEVGNTSRNNTTSRDINEDLSEIKDGIKTDDITENSSNTQSLDNNSISNLTENTEQNDTEESEVVVNRRESGFNIPLSELLIKHRETFLNIDLMVINALRPLFMQIYGW